METSIVCDVTVRSHKQRTVADRALEFSAWQRLALERAVLITSVYLVAVMLIVVAAYFCVLYGVEFTARQNDVWLTASLMGIIAGPCRIHDDYDTSVVRLPASPSFSCGCILLCDADGIFSQPLRIVVTVLVRFALKLRHSRAEDVVFKDIAPVHMLPKLYDAQQRVKDYDTRMRTSAFSSV